MPGRLIIFDADGTLRRTTVAGQPCPYQAGEWELLPEVQRRLCSLGPEIDLGVASNQDRVGYGHVTLVSARQLLVAMIEQASGRRLARGAIQLCPHVLEFACACRKPAPGMLLRIMRHYGRGRRATLFVGNAETDRGAALNAGVRFAWAHEFFAW